MPRDPSRFTELTKNTLAKRAGFRCSNPYCRTITVGPHMEEDKAIGIGEAAHIRGANPGSARYEEAMTTEERSVITNAIWLCRRCARLIDTDERRYSVEILYKWKLENEDDVFYEIEGGAEEKDKRNILKKAFESEPLSALQIVIDKPEYWEYLLAIELLRNKSNDVKKKFGRLERGLEYKPSKAVYGREFLHWFQARIHDLSSIVQMFCVVISDELMASFGKPGEPGDPVKILEASKIIANGCDALIEWERTVKYTLFPEDFEDIKKMLLGWSNAFINEIDRIHNELAKMFDQDGVPKGEYSINLIFRVPDNFEEVTDTTLQRMKSYLA